MRLAKFEHMEPASLAEAFGLLKKHGQKAAVIAGGTDLLVRLKNRLVEPELIVNIKNIESLRKIAVDGAVLRIGALSTIRDIRLSPIVSKLFPLLTEAASLLAAPQLQNMGTLGGNLCLDTRCWYYDQSRDWRKSLETCLKAGGAVCHIAKASRRCYALYCGDLAPALLALKASVKVASAKGERVLPLADFFVEEGIKRNVLRPGELVAEVAVPIMPGQRGAYVKFRHRESIDFPVVGVAAAIVQAKGVCSEVGIGITGVLSAPIVAEKSQALILGKKLGHELIQEAAEAAFRQVRPVSNMECSPAYRRQLVRVLVEDALTRAAGLQPRAQ